MGDDVVAHRQAQPPQNLKEIVKMIARSAILVQMRQRRDVIHRAFLRRLGPLLPFPVYRTAQFRHTDAQFLGLGLGLTTEHQRVQRSQPPHLGIQRCLVGIRLDILGKIRNRRPGPRRRRMRTDMVLPQIGQRPALILTPMIQRHLHGKRVLVKHRQHFRRTQTDFKQASGSPVQRGTAILAMLARGQESLGLRV